MYFLYIVNTLVSAGVSVYMCACQYALRLVSPDTVLVNNNKVFIKLQLLSVETILSAYTHAHARTHARTHAHENTNNTKKNLHATKNRQQTN